MTLTRPIDIDENSLTPEQKRVHDEILSGPRGIVEGPLRVWLMNPGLADRAQALGAYCRYGTALRPELSEMAIIMVGAHWRAGFEWAVHAPIAAKAGVPADVIEAIRRGEAPRGLGPEAQAVHDVTEELLRMRTVSDATFARAGGVLGRTAMIDLVGILGYYTFICMTINAFAVPLPEGVADPFAGQGG
jgi:4-carboxymuconolactone decarboxylase